MTEGMSTSLPNHTLNNSSPNTHNKFICCMNIFFALITTWNTQKIDVMYGNMNNTYTQLIHFFENSWTMRDSNIPFDNEKGTNRHLWQFLALRVENVTAWATSSKVHDGMFYHLFLCPMIRYSNSPFLSICILHYVIIVFECMTSMENILEIVYW